MAITHRCSGVRPRPTPARACTPIDRHPAGVRPAVGHTGHARLWEDVASRRRMPAATRGQVGLSSELQTGKTLHLVYSAAHVSALWPAEDEGLMNSAGDCERSARTTVPRAINVMAPSAPKQ
jgi:hypothetical protein